MPSIYIAAKDASESENLLNDSRELILHIDALSAIGEDSGLKRLDEYIYAPLEDISEFLTNAGTTEEELKKASVSVWYEPKEGGKLITDYIDLVRKYHSLSKSTKKAVIPELEMFKKILCILEKENNKWRFQYDF